MFLTEQQIIELTGYKRRDAQVRALRTMGIEHRCRPNGSLVVFGEHVQSIFTGSSHRMEKPYEINTSGINA